MLYADIVKALDLLRTSAPIADAKLSLELNDAAKIIKGFQKPSIVSHKKGAFNDQASNAPNGVDRASEGLYPLTKLLQGVEKSYDPGNFLLGESAKTTENSTTPSFSLSDNIEDVKNQNKREKNSITEDNKLYL